MSDHTKGRLHADGPVVIGRGKTIIVCCSEQDGEELDRANARRLVACWNACEGISTEALEQPRGLAGAIEPVASELLVTKNDLKDAGRDRDELFAALRLLQASVSGYLNPAHEDRHYYRNEQKLRDAAQAAIGHIVKHSQTGPA